VFTAKYENDRLLEFITNNFELSAEKESLNMNEDVNGMHVRKLGMKIALID
jgi:hypothetical protein